MIARGGVPQVAVVSVSLVLLAGCGNDAFPAEKKWASREALHSCGHLHLKQGDSLKRASKEGVACLRAARRSGQGAEFTVTYLTPEGDPIVGYYRVTTKQVFEMYSDSTADKFGEQRWTYQQCPEAEPLPGLDC